MLVFQALCTSGKNMGQRVALKYAHTAYEAASLTREQKFCEKVGQHPNCQPLLDNRKAGFRGDECGASLQQGEPVRESGDDSSAP